MGPSTPTNRYQFHITRFTPFKAESSIGEDSSSGPSALKHFHRILNDRRKESEAFKGIV